MRKELQIKIELALSNAKDNGHGPELRTMTLSQLAEDLHDKDADLEIFDVDVIESVLKGIKYKDLL